MSQNAIDMQVGGGHYKKFGHYQPWEVLQRWLTAEEFRGFMKGTAIAYLARERYKGNRQDIAKAAHTLRAYLEMTEEQAETNIEEKQKEGERERNLHKFTGGQHDINFTDIERLQQLNDKRREPGSTYIKSDD